MCLFWIELFGTNRLFRMNLNELRADLFKSRMKTLTNEKRYKMLYLMANGPMDSNSDLKMTCKLSVIMHGFRSSFYQNALFGI